MYLKLHSRVLICFYLISSLFDSNLSFLLMKVEKPDPTNHTDARNPSTHAEEKGLYRLSFICFSKHLDIYSIKSIFLMSLKILEVLKVSTVFNLSCYALEVWTVLEFAPYDLVFYPHHWFSNCGTWPPPCGYLWRNVQIYILYCQDTTQCVMKINNTFVMS